MNGDRAGEMTDEIWGGGGVGMKERAGGRHEEKRQMTAKEGGEKGGRQEEGASESKRGKEMLGAVPNSASSMRKIME
eukprot:4403379-Pleurochrysis_carterae.AAC.1